MASNETKNPLCEPCLVQKKHAAAAVICQECENEYLCEGCSGVHKSQKMTKLHNLFPIEDLKNKAVQGDHVTGMLTKFESLTVKVVHETTQSVERTMTSHMTVENMSKSPGKPYALNVGCDYIFLYWDPPSFFKEGFSFQINIKECTHDTSKWKPYGEFTDACARISNLKANTPFVFRVRVLYGDEEGPYSAISEKVTTSISLSSRVAASCKPTGMSTTPQTLQLPLKEMQSARNTSLKTRMFEFGDAKREKEEKIIMMIGETGTGKSTLVNGIVNYIFGVNWDDPYRFSIINLEPEEQKKLSNQAESQTEWITCYKIYTEDGCRIPYTITIIDTPGFGDTRGLTRDNEIVSQIRGLFSYKPPHGVLTINAVCFSIKASDSRLSTMQKYIFDSVLSLFGKDIKDNICPLLTFADDKDPVVLDALEKSKFPFGQHFKFNNSALFGTNSNVGKSNWEMGMLGFKNFFDHLESLDTKSLQLTIDVLSERHFLEMTLKDLEPCLNDGILKLSQIKKEQKLIEDCERTKSITAKYTYEVDVPKKILVDNPLGKFVTNCKMCSFTCHDKCTISTDLKLKGCWAIGGNGYCKICEKRCSWESHFSTKQVYRTIVVKENRTINQILLEYGIAEGKQLTAQATIAKMNADIKELAEIIDDILYLIHESKKKLSEIALCHNPVNLTDIIDIMIKNEKASRKDGDSEKIKELSNLREKAVLVDKGKAFTVDVLGVSLDSNINKIRDRQSVKERLKKFFYENICND